MSADKVIQEWKGLNLNIRRKPYIREYWEVSPSDKSGRKHYEEILVGDGKVFVTRNIQTSDMVSIIKNVNQQNWNI